MSMERNYFSVLFYIKKAKLLKNGEAPICLRITVNGKRAEIQIKRSVEIDKWNARRECAIGKDRKYLVSFMGFAPVENPQLLIYCIVDDTIASHTRPSSQAVHPIEAAYFHQSHLKGCQDYGHQVVSVMLSCNGITLNYAVILYDKSRSKIQIVQEIAEELPAAPVISYFLCDSWYTTAKVMDRFIRKGFYTVGALKTNRILYPCGIRQKASAFALHLRKTDPDVSLVTVGSREFYVYRYEGELNGIPNAAVILSYPKDGFGNPKALRVFLSTNAELSTQEILDTYTKRWPIELFFRQSKSKLALDSYQIRSRQGIQRYWLIMSLVHYLCCMHSGNYCTFEEGYASLKQQLKQEQFANLYRLIKSSASFEEASKFVG